MAGSETKGSVINDLLTTGRQNLLVIQEVFASQMARSADQTSKTLLPDEASKKGNTTLN
jgi:hypothetical protein